MIDSIKVEEVKSDGTKKEINTDPSSGYHNYLVMFNTLTDLDFGILRMIQAEYNNTKFILVNSKRAFFTALFYFSYQLHYFYYSLEIHNPITNNPKITL